MTASILALAAPLAGRSAASIPVEAQLIASACAGNEAAFERLYRRHVARIHTLASRMASPDAADDLTQDIFIRTWDKLPTFRQESSFATWLHRLAVNLILGRRRDERQDRYWFIDSDSPVADHPAHQAPAGLRLDLETAIARLPTGARQIFVLYDIEGWTHEEIAEQLGVAVGTSKSQLSRARATLRELLDDR